MSRLKHYKERRRTEAQERAEERAKRSPREQIAKLDKMLGKDQGATKERARLRKQAAKAKTIRKNLDKEE